MKTVLLAWRKHPKPKGTNYSEKDLIQKIKAIELFNYCQILEAAIFDKGWKFLFENYGLKGIIEIDRESGWLNEDDLGEWIASIFYHSLISGFEPLKMQLGTYSEETRIFKALDGSIREIDWKEIYNLKEKLLSLQLNKP